jgi:hypothetical protein
MTSASSHPRVMKAGQISSSGPITMMLADHFYHFRPCLSGSKAGLQGPDANRHHPDRSCPFGIQCIGIELVMVGLEAGYFHKKRNLFDIFLGKKPHQDRLGSHLQVGIDKSRGRAAGFKEPIDFVVTE